MQAKNEKVSREVFDKMDNAPLISSVLLDKNRSARSELPSDVSKGDFRGFPKNSGFCHSSCLIMW